MERYSPSTNQIANLPGGSYDIVGNQLYDGSHRYTYDADGNVTQVDNGSTASFTYDSLNRRTRIQEGSSAADLIYDASNQTVSTWNASSGYSLIEARIYADGQPVAFRAQGSTHFQRLDYLGTARAATGSGDGRIYAELCRQRL